MTSIRRISLIDSGTPGTLTEAVLSVDAATMAKVADAVLRDARTHLDDAGVRCHLICAVVSIDITAMVYDEGAELPTGVLPTPRNAKARVAEIVAAVKGAKAKAEAKAKEASNGEA